VSVIAVIADGVVSLTSSSSNQALLLDDAPVKVAGPAPELEPPPPDAAAVTVTGRLSVRLSVPLLPVMLTLPVPAVAVAAAARVSTLVEGVAEALKLAVTPLGRPLAASATLPVKPPDGVTEMVDVPLAPWTTDTAEGLAERLKAGTGAAVTARETRLVLISEPLVPVMVITVVCAAAALEAVKVRTDELVDEAGLKEAVTPLGTPLIEKLTLPVKPPAGATAIVDVPLLPWTSERLDGLADSVKPGPATGVNIKVAIE
jgi:hypothetical protein